MDNEMKQLGVDSTGDTLFDASQYAFFGNKAIVEEVELGGLEEEEEEEGLCAVEFKDQEYPIEREELITVDSGPRGTRVIGDGGSRESSSAAGWTYLDVNLFDQHTFDNENIQEGKRWSAHPHSCNPHLAESVDLYKTSSYPEQQQQPQPQPQRNLHHQHYSSEQILYPPPGGRSQQDSPKQRLNMTHLVGGPHLPSSLPFGGKSPQFKSRPPNQWVDNQTGFHPTENYNGTNNLLSHQIRLMPPELRPQQQPQQHILHHHPVQPQYGHLSGMQSQVFNNSHVSPIPHIMNKYGIMHEMGDRRDQRPRSVQNNRSDIRFSNQGFNISSQKSDVGWPQFRSKHMTEAEINNIMRMQLAATHSNDPYVEDYYHMARLAKKSNREKLKHHFCPVHLLPRIRANSEEHAFLQVDALGRIPFSSIRKPWPLLEIDTPNLSGPGSPKHEVSEKHLEQEPLLAARVAIEDGHCLSFDVDDIDRYLQYNQLQDRETTLKRRRLVLEGLATYFQLIDPLERNGQNVKLSPKDDMVFLRLVSLPKGRKLLLRYLQLLFPGDKLIRVVCMAIFRHLRFFFGTLPSDPETANTTVNLAYVVASCVRDMNLAAVSACLATVVCSSEQPPLRPLGSPKGDGASVILNSILKRATDLLTDPQVDRNFNTNSRSLWQASFDDFFGLLTKSSESKYDTIIRSIRAQAPMHMDTMGSDAARAIRKEMPVDLLRASLPHMNDQQKKLLLEFAQRSMLVTESTCT